MWTPQATVRRLGQRSRARIRLLRVSAGRTLWTTDALLEVTAGARTAAAAVLSLGLSPE